MASTIHQLLDENEKPQRTIGKTERWLWPLSGFLGLCLVLVWLEVRLPFYFTQDDNLAQNLPSILWGCRSLFHGVFPTWNPYQYLGSPNTTLGWYALTYPPTYFSYWFAKTLLGNEYATIEVFVFLHLSLAYLVFYRLARKEGCRPSIAMLGASCCMTSGYALIFSRSWFQFCPILLWIGVLALCVQSFAKGSHSWQWIAAFGIAIGIAFHSGHIQMWTYTVLLADFAIILLFATRVVSWRAIWAPVAAHFLALAIAAPLLVPELAVSIHVGRPSLDARGITPGIAGLFLPASIWPTAHPSGWGCSGRGCFIGEMYYSGTLFTGLAAILLVSAFASRWTRKVFRRNIWFCCAALAFWLALGDRGFLWTMMMHIPGFDHFRYPFKFLAYVVFFGSLAGAMAMERLMRNRGWKLKTELALAATMWAVLVYHSQACNTAFFVYGFKPFPVATAAISNRLISHDPTLYPKVFAVVGHPDGLTEGRFANPSPNYYNTFRNQWATVLGIFSIEGYDPLVSQMPSVQAMGEHLKTDLTHTLSEYGVQYLLRFDLSKGRLPLWQPSTLPGAKIVYSSSDIQLYELPAARPMAFSLAAPDFPLRVRFDGSGATIATSSLRGGPMILNLLWKPEYHASANGNSLLVSADDWNRIRVQVPAGIREVRIDYRPRWELGYAVSIVALVCGVFIGKWSIRDTELGSPDAKDHAMAIKAGV